MEKDAVTLVVSRRFLLLSLFFVIFYAAMSVALFFVFVIPVVAEYNWVVGLLVIAFEGVFVMFTRKAIIERKRGIKKRLVLDAEGIKAEVFSVLWSDVAECYYKRVPYGKSGTRRTLNIKTFDNRTFCEFMNTYRFDKYELISMINRLAGRRVFNLEYAILQEKHDRVLSICMWGAMVAISASFYIFCFYCVDSKLSTEENIMWWCVIGVLMALGTYGSYTYMQSWNRRHNYKD